MTDATESPDPHGEGPAPGPFSALLGFRYVIIDDTEALVEADPGPQHCNGGGIVHGGFLASLVCRAHCVSVGGRIGSTEAEITQLGRVVARAIGTHAVLSR